MDVTATEARNRLGHMLDQCQREPVCIGRSGRRHSVLLSAVQYEALLVASRAQAALADAPAHDATEFYARHKVRVDAENARFERVDIWNQEFRCW